YQPIGAVLTTGRIFDTIVGGSGFFQHGHTYTGHLAACAGALAVQKVIRDENLRKNVRKRGARLRDALEQRLGKRRHVGHIRGRGLLLALELVKDRGTKEPFSSSSRIAARLKETALEQGLMCYPMGGVIDGVLGDHVMLAPPFNIERKHVDEMVEKLGAAV